MISFRLEPEQIEAKRQVDLALILQNQSPGVCTEIHFKLRLPPELTPVDSARTFYFSSLPLRGHETCPLCIHAPTPGTFYLVIYDLHLYNHHRRFHELPNQRVPLQVQPVGQPRPALLVLEGLQEELIRGSWEALTGTLVNRGRGPAHNLRLFLRGPGIRGETLDLKTVASGTGTPVTLSVIAEQGGTRVPVSIHAEYVDERGKSRQQVWQRYLHVWAEVPSDVPAPAADPSFHEIRAALLDCGLLANPQDLTLIFADPRLSPWRKSFPEAAVASHQARVERLLHFLTGRQNREGTPALHLLLDVLADRISPGDLCHRRLRELRAGLDK